MILDWAGTDVQLWIDGWNWIVTATSVVYIYATNLVGLGNLEMARFSRCLIQLANHPVYLGQGTRRQRGIVANPKRCSLDARKAQGPPERPPIN